MKIKLKTSYWTQTRTPEEYKAQIDKWMYWFSWIMVGHIALWIYQSKTTLLIIDGIIFAVLIMIQITYKQYKKERDKWITKTIKK